MLNELEVLSDRITLIGALMQGAWCRMIELEDEIAAAGTFAETRTLFGEWAKYADRHAVLSGELSVANERLEAMVMS